MKYRDHISTGVLFMPCFYLLNKAGFGRFVPFVSPARGITENFLLCICFFAGLSFPDIDVKHYGRRHRTRSPLHDIVNIGLFYALSAVLALHTGLNIGFCCLNAFACGCLCHLAGDFIQGGVGLRRRRIGLTCFSWRVYTETWLGTVFTAALTCVSFIAVGLVYMRCPLSISGSLLTAFIGSFLFSSYWGALCFYIPAVALALANHFGLLAYIISRL